MSIEKWVENAKGNLVAVGDDRVIGTVYRTDDGCWSAVWNKAADRPLRLKGKRRSAEEVQDTIERAESVGIDPDKWYPPDSEWQPRKEGGHYRKLSGAIVSVKQARSGSWYATMSGALLGQGGEPTWFANEHEAMAAVDQSERRRGDRAWIRKQ
jgi:hypothetical protein